MTFRQTFSELPLGRWNDVHAHDWRLFARSPQYDTELTEDGGAIMATEQSGWLEIWYCTGCRVVEEREASA